MIAASPKAFKQAQKAMTISQEPIDLKDPAFASFDVEKKTPPRPLAMDPIIKKLDSQPATPAGEGVQVANNSGNTNVTTSQYFMGESSKTGDSRVLSYQGNGY